MDDLKTGPANLPEKPTIIKSAEPSPASSPPPAKTSSKKKLAMIALTLLVVVLGGISIATAWRLRQVEKVTPEPGRAATTPHTFTSADWTQSDGGGDNWKGTHSNYEVTVGPGPLDFVASGFGMKNHSSGTIHLEIPQGATVEKAFVFWAGQKSVGRRHNCNVAGDEFCMCRMGNMATRLNVDAHYCQTGIGDATSRLTVYPDQWNIFVHDNPPNCCINDACFDCERPECERCEGKASEADCPAYGTYFADVTNEIKQRFPDGTTIFDISVGDMYFWSSNSAGSGEGVGVVLIYRQDGLPEAKIKLKHWGQFILRARTDTMTFDVSDINTDVGNEIKAVFFFNEAEAHSPGDGNYEYRPNYLYYNGQILNPSPGTGRYVAYSTENPYDPTSADNDIKWWDTRISGVNLDPIIYQGAPLEFEVWSPNEGTGPDPSYMGESLGFSGAAVKYITGPGVTPTPTPTPGPLICLSLEGSPDPAGLSPGDEITLTCTGTSDPALPIDHFDFRVSTDSAEPTPISGPIGATEVSPGEWQANTTFVIPEYACYLFECRACRSSDSSECTAWGQAE